jgi:hypothetical protein
MNSLYCATEYAFLGLDGDKPILTPIVVYGHGNTFYAASTFLKAAIPFEDLPLINIKWPNSPSPPPLEEEPCHLDQSVSECEVEEEEPQHPIELDLAYPCLSLFSETLSSFPSCIQTLLCSTASLKFKPKFCDIRRCKGNCGEPLHTPDYIQLVNAYENGITWGDLVDEWEREKPKAKPVAKPEPETKEIVMEPERQLQLAKMKNFFNQPQTKVYEPCQHLYNKTKYVSSECHGHIFTDCMTHELVNKNTGKLLKRAYKESLDVAIQEGYAQVAKAPNGIYVLQYMPRSCNRIHPGEAGWESKWFTKNPIKV